MTLRIAIIAAAVTVAAAFSARAAPSPKRAVAVLEFRGGSTAVPDIARRAATLLRKLTSLRIIDADDARAAGAEHIDADVAQCAGEPRCVAAIGRRLGADEVLLVGVSEFGDVILTLQRVDVRRRAVVARVAEALARDASPDDDDVSDYLRRVMPRSDFLRYGTIRIAANVAGARVFVGGMPRGTTPVPPIRVRAPGRYDIEVRMPGYAAFRASVEVPPDAAVQVHAALEPTSRAWYQKWWVAAIAGTVAAGAVTAAVLLSRDEPTTVPADVRAFELRF